MSKMVGFPVLLLYLHVCWVSCAGYAAGAAVGAAVGAVNQDTINQEIQYFFSNPYNRVTY